MPKREDIAPGGVKRSIRREDLGRIRTPVEEGRSLSDDARHKAIADVQPGHGGRGDHHAR